MESDRAPDREEECVVMECATFKLQMANATSFFSCLHVCELRTAHLAAMPCQLRHIGIARKLAHLETHNDIFSRKPRPRICAVSVSGRAPKTRQSTF